MQGNGKPGKYLLGIDLGVQSAGWAVIGLDERGDPSKVLCTGVRQLVQDKLSQLGITDPKKAFADQQNLPYFRTRNGGRLVPVRKARVHKSTATQLAAVRFEQGYCALTHHRNGTPRVYLSDDSQQATAASLHHTPYPATLITDSTRWPGFIRPAGRSCRSESPRSRALSPRLP